MACQRLAPKRSFASVTTTVALLGATLSVMTAAANNSYFLPGDAFFHGVISADEAARLLSSDALELEYA